MNYKVGDSIWVRIEEGDMVRYEGPCLVDWVDEARRNYQYNCKFPIEFVLIDGDELTKRCEVDSDEILYVL